MKIYFCLFLSLILWAKVLAQLETRGNSEKSRGERLQRLYAQATNDGIRYQIANQLWSYYENSNADSSNYYIEIGLSLSRKNRKNLAESGAMTARAYQSVISGQYASSLEDLIKAFSIIEKVDAEADNWIMEDPYLAKLSSLATTHHIYATLMTPTKNTEQQISHYKQALKLGTTVNNPTRQVLSNLGLGRTFLDLNMLDSAMIYLQQGEEISLQSGFKNYLAPILSYSGLIHYKRGELVTALETFYRGIQSAMESSNLGGLAQNYFQLTNYYLQETEKDSALFYARKFKGLMEQLGSISLSTVDRGMAYESVYRAFLLNNKLDSAFKYQGMALTTKDSLYKSKINNLAKFQVLSFNEQMRMEQIEREKEEFKNKVIVASMLSGLLIFFLISFILFRNNRQKRKANQVLEKTLDNLTSTQAQLIQSEKMASLGELTAGIAHEIQNPLNFVNNFSEVNLELIDEMKTELKQGNTSDALEITDMLGQNLQKIAHHGKRADGIVKGMLQHSRKTTDKKEPTNINALADEYVRLSYHGFRAKEKTFNATIETNFDKSIGELDVIPQDIGRVLLNLLNNAFYAVNEKNKQSTTKAGEDYVPKVSVSTEKKNGAVIVKVTDNGVGIPEKVLNKIYQPFFTTKPTGEGTGLGLSLSYDIITKGHGGQMKVETKEGEGTTFIIQLPKNIL